MASPKPKVLITLPFDPAGLARLQQVADVDLRPNLTSEALESVIGGYQAVIVSSNQRLIDRTIEYAHLLQVIGVAGASLERVNVSAARAQGVQVVNVPDRRTIARAEQTMGLMLNLGLQKHAVGLAERTLGIVGFGALGQEVARRARAFGMRVLVHQPRLTPELALEGDLEQRELHHLLTESDYVTLFLPESPETNHLICEEELQRLRPSSFLINAGSPHAVDMHALTQALQDGHLAGAALLMHKDEIAAIPKGLEAKLLLAEYHGPSHAEAERDIALTLAEHVIQHLETLRPREQLSLRVVELEKVVPHEHFDPQRVDHLVAALENADTLVNPPVVVDADECYVVLDGATRCQAFKRMGFPHIVVQVVSPEDKDLLLHTWYHAVCGPSSEALLAHLQSTSEFKLQSTSPEGLQLALDQGEAICSVRTPDAGNFLVHPNPEHSRLRALNALVAAYTEIGRIHRTLNTTMRELKAENADIAALIIFPQFRLQDVLTSAAKGQLLPAGITRFVIPGRVLRLCADLEKLRADEPLALKNAWLDRFLTERLSHRKPRYYQEPVLLLDD